MRFVIHCSSLDNFSVPTHFNYLSEQDVGGLEGRAGLPALQLLPCHFRSCVSREGHGAPYISVYLVDRVLCYLVQYASPITLLLINSL